MTERKNKHYGKKIEFTGRDLFKNRKKLFSFPSLEDIAKDFYKKNNLSKPRITKNNGGLIMVFPNKNSVFLSIKYSNEESNLLGNTQRYIQGSAEYNLSGTLNNQNIYLRAIVTNDSNLNDGEVTSPVTNTERIDNKKYWFLVPSKKTLAS